MPDLNYLRHRQQMELLRAQEAQCTEARLAHAALARAYGRQIDARLNPESGQV